jgi:hypothetical protein
MIATMTLRTIINIGVTMNMHHILEAKLKDQYAVGQKDALLIIIHTFDRYVLYKDILNQHLSQQNYMHNTKSIHTKTYYTNIIRDYNQNNGLANDIVDDDIINLLLINNDQMNQYKVIMSDDQENCFNRINRVDR